MFNRKQSEKEKRVGGNMRGDGALEMLLNEIPQMNSLNHHLHRQNNHHHPLFMSVSPSSSSFSGGFSSSEEGFSPSMVQMDQNLYQTPSTHYLNSPFVKNSNDYMLDELGLCEILGRVNIGGPQKDYSKVRRLDPDGFGFGGSSYISLDGSNPCSFDSYGTSDGFGTDFLGYEGFQSPIHGNSLSYDDELKSKLLGLKEGYNVGNLRWSRLAENQSNSLYSEPSCYNEGIDYHGRGFSNGGPQLHDNPSVNRPYCLNELCSPRRSGTDYIRDRCLLNPLSSSELVCPNLNFSMGSPVCNSNPMLKEKMRAIPNGRAPPILSTTDAGDVEGFSCEDSFIIQGKSLEHVVGKRSDGSKGKKKKSHDEIAMKNEREKRKDQHGQSSMQGICGNGLSQRNYSPLLLQPTFSSLTQVQGYIYPLAKNQSGCRFLQKIFDEGTRQDVCIIFNETISHVVELMMNSFGNYLMQKLLEVCSEEQRMQIVLMVTEVPGDLVRTCLNTHGTRVVQKLIETLKTRQQISLVTSALEPGFLELITDLNGNHVIQRCLQCLSKEDNKFIFDAATKFCVDIATHQHGCCVMNRCITQSVGKYREMLVGEIAANGLHLAQHAFGNYVVQYIIELKIPSAAAILYSQFEGHYVYLSTQKFGSHVVEKFLKCCEESRPKIIRELLSVPHFEQLLQDPFANYVIQSALKVCKGALHASLVEAVRPHNILRASPYCKKIFSRNLLKK